MQFQSQVRVTGMKANKGTMDNGQSYDSTKVYVETALDASRGNAAGFATAEYSFGKSETFDRFKAHQFPFNAMATFEMVTTGKLQKMQLLDIAPLPAPKAA